MDTIYALASARGRAGISVLRVSGPKAFAACEALAGDVPPLRRASLRKLRWNGETIDEALVTTFGAGHSFTGEDVVEFAVHGSLAVIAEANRALAAQPGLRPALAGEFTRRALENGRIDLTQAEGLADLIDAETEAQRKQAQRVLSGALAERTEAWRRGLVRAAALLEATIDFVDEDVPIDVTPEVRMLVGAVQADLSRELAGARAAERIRDGFEVAVLGAPNAGKSTLINYIAGRNVVLTSDIPGTTRDVIEVRLDLDGLAVTLLDTAGLRETGDGLERLGMERAIERAEQADLRVLLLSAADDVAQWTKPKAGDIVVRGKADVSLGGVGLAVSGKTGAGVDELLRAVSAELSRQSSSASSLIRERHRIACESSSVALADCMVEIDNQQAELAAEHLRTALRNLDSLVGRVDVETLLGEIFASFCIGK